LHFERSNEIAVAVFFREEVGFLEMSDLMQKTLAKAEFIAHQV